MTSHPKTFLSDNLYYNRGREAERLQRATGKLEEARTRDILQRFLPPSGTVWDIGGGAGVYALWLAQLGYEVHLVDAVPLHIEQAQAASDEQPDHPLASATVGDARKIDAPDECADAVLLLGPLYHLTEETDRIQALREAYRILKPNGVVFAAAISRFASLIDGLTRGFLQDDYFSELVAQDLENGQHRNPDNLPGYFTTAYFHQPAELPAEVNAAGFRCEPLKMIEGPAGLIPDFDTVWEDEKMRERIVNFLRQIETEPTLLGLGSHLMAVGHK